MTLRWPSLSIRAKLQPAPKPSKVSGSFSFLIGSHENRLFTITCYFHHIVGNFEDVRYVIVVVRVRVNLLGGHEHGGSVLFLVRLLYQMYLQGRSYIRYEMNFRNESNDIASHLPQLRFGFCSSF